MVRAAPMAVLESRNQDALPLAQLTLSDSLYARLKATADARGDSIEAVLEDAVTALSGLPPSPSPLNNPLIDQGDILRDVALGVLIQGPEAEIYYTNQVALDYLGLTEDQLLGKTSFDPDWNVIHEDGSPFPGDTHPVPVAIRTRQPVRGVLMGVSRPSVGDRVWLMVNAVPQLGPDGKLLRVICSFDDVTAQKQAEWALAEINQHLEDYVKAATEALRQERDLLARIMEASPAGITVVDKDGKISFSNRRSEEIYAAPTAQVIQRSYDSAEWRHTDYDGNPWPDEQQPFVQVMRTRGPVYDVRHAIEWPDGQRVYLSINGAPLFDENGEIAKVVFTLEDYTERKRAQDRLEQALERERGLNELKSRFITTVSHEFRTPLAIIMSSTGIIRQQIARLTPEQILERLNRIDSQVQQLTHLLEDMTFISKADDVGHRVNPTPVVLIDFFNQLVSEMNSRYEAGQIGLSRQEATGPEAVMLDEALLYQVCSNLLSNAIKYSQPGGAIWVNYGCEREADDASYTLILRISDQGIGIPERDQARIFERFHRAGNVGNISGTGLGLTVTQQAVEALGGSIRFESAPGAGTTFIVELPTQPAPERISPRG
jgi:PAS domain S-box-containing protein